MYCHSLWTRIGQKASHTKISLGDCLLGRPLVDVEAGVGKILLQIQEMVSVKDLPMVATAHRLFGRG